MVEKKDQIDVESFLKFPLLLFRLLLFDIKPLRENPSIKDKFIHGFKNFYCPFCLVGLVFCAASCGLYGLVNLDVFEEAASGLTNVLSVIIIGFKGYATFVGKTDIWNIVQELLAMTRQRFDEKKSYDLRKYLNEYQNYMKIYAAVFLSVWLRILGSIVPLVLYGTLHTAVKFWYPFDDSRPENFIYVLIWSDWVGSNCCILLIASDSLLYALMATVAMEFELLSPELLSLEQEPEAEKLLKLSRIVERQNQLLQIADKLEEMYRASFLCSVVADSFSICFLLFTLSKSTDISTSAYDVPHLLAMVGQTFLLCFFGQKLIDSSQSVADGVYHSNWENFSDDALKKNLILIILRSQKAKKLTAMSFVDISLPTFASILTSAGSYFSLLKTLSSDDD